jgi:hypothetical protein
MPSVSWKKYGIKAKGKLWSTLNYKLIWAENPIHVCF